MPVWQGVWVAVLAMTHNITALQSLSTKILCVSARSSAALALIEWQPAQLPELVEAVGGIDPTNRARA
jgi:hypothetical protein